jgi:hypothetical protein
MTINECIERLIQLRGKHGDIQCEVDCPHCGQSFRVGVVAVAPETVRLNKAGGSPEAPRL